MLVFSVRSVTKFGCDLQENAKIYVQALSVCCSNGRKMKHVTGDSTERNFANVVVVIVVVVVVVAPVDCLVLRWWSGECVRNVAPV